MNPVSAFDPAPALLTADGMVGLVFLVMIGVTLTGGFIAATADRLVRALAGVVICFAGVAGFYYFLNSPFMAMMQILIYVGAICVTISFAIMLAAPEQKKQIGPTNILTGPLGFLVAGLVFAAMTALALRTEWQPFTKTGDGSVRDIGLHLLTGQAMVFELISIVLLIAIIGAIVIARGGRTRS